MVDGATSELIPLVSAVPLGSVFGPPLLFTFEMFELVDDRLYAYEVESTIPAVNCYCC